MSTPVPEQPVRLNAGSAFISWALCGLVCGAAPWAGQSIGLWKPEVSLSAMLGSILVSCIMLTGLLAMAPWGARTPSAWSTRWLAATVIRFVGTPFLALLLYSRPPSAEAFLLSVAGTYLVSLAVETAVVARLMLASVVASERRVNASDPHQTHP